MQPSLAIYNVGDQKYPMPHRHRISESFLFLSSTDRPKILTNLAIPNPQVRVDSRGHHRACAACVHVGKLVVLKGGNA